MDVQADYASYRSHYTVGFDDFDEFRDERCGI